jgi:hypothetical protein
MRIGEETEAAAPTVSFDSYIQYILVIYPTHSWRVAALQKNELNLLKGFDPTQNRVLPQDGA